MEVLQQIIVMLVTLGVLVSFHEYGHFWVARRCGVKVLRFSVGFGKSLFSWQGKTGTEYVIAAIPLGGYVKMLDEREGDVSEQDKPYAFNGKSVWQRILIVAAGPVANFLLAIIVYWFIFLQGVTQLIPVVYQVDAGSVAAQAGVTKGFEIIKVDGVETASAQAVVYQLLNRIGTSGTIQLVLRQPRDTETKTVLLPIHRWLADADDQVNPVADLGLHFYTPEVKPIIEKVVSGSPAASAGIEKGDLILSVDQTAVTTWQQWVDYVQNKPGIPIEVLVDRANKKVQLQLTPEARQRKGSVAGYAGVGVKSPETAKELLRHQSYNLVSAWAPAVKKTWQNIVFSLSSIKKLVVGDLSYKQLSGPISIAQIANDSFKISFFAFLSLLALLSVSLGVLNLLPIPVLDGGHIFFYLIEWIKGSPVPEKVQLFAYQIGMALVMGIMLLAIFNDINRL